MAELNALTERQDFWDDPKKSQKLMRERSILEESFNRIKSLISDLSENLEIAELGESEGDRGSYLKTAVAALRGDT